MNINRAHAIITRFDDKNHNATVLAELHDFIDDQQTLINMIPSKSDAILAVIEHDVAMIDLQSTILKSIHLTCEDKLAILNEMLLRSLETKRQQVIALKLAVQQV